jgi:hypothetical protein
MAAKMTPRLKQQRHKLVSIDFPPTQELQTLKVYALPGVLDNYPVEHTPEPRKQKHAYDTGSAEGWRHPKRWR